MSLKINKERSNIIDNIDDDFIRNWNVKANDELTKIMSKQISDSINAEILKTLLDSSAYIDSHPKNVIFDSYNHPMYRPELTVKLNKNEQIVF